MFLSSEPTLDELLDAIANHPLDWTYDSTAKVCRFTHQETGETVLVSGNVLNALHRQFASAILFQQGRNQREFLLGTLQNWKTPFPVTTVDQGQHVRIATITGLTFHAEDATFDVCGPHYRFLYWREDDNYIAGYANEQKTRLGRDWFDQYFPGHWDRLLLGVDIGMDAQALAALLYTPFEPTVSVALPTLVCE